MSFLQDEFLQVLEDSPTGYRVTIISGKGCYIENVKKLLGFSDTEILVLVNGKVIAVSGKNLKIDGYFAGDMQISGKITSFNEK